MSYIEFIIETVIVNSVPIFIGIGIFAFIFGVFLKNIGSAKYTRIIIYATVGIGFGLWSYSHYDIPERALQLNEALILGVGIFVYSLIFIIPVVLLKNRPSKTIKEE